MRTDCAVTRGADSPNDSLSRSTRVKSSPLLSTTTAHVRFFEIPQAELGSAVAAHLLSLAHGVLVVFDCTSNASILALDDWRPRLRTHQQPVPVLLFGNKDDVGKPVVEAVNMDQVRAWRALGPGPGRLRRAF